MTDLNNPETIEIHGLRTITKLCHFGADNNMEGCTFTEIVERLFADLEKAKAQAVPEGYVLMPKECPDPIFADSFFKYLRSKCYTEEKGFEYIYLSDIDETEIWNFAVNASESGAEQ